MSIDTTNLTGEVISRIATGCDHNLLLSHEGTVFGPNDAGQTGLGAASGATLIAAPIDTTKLVGTIFNQVAASSGHNFHLAVPGPSSFALLAAALLAFTGLRRRKR